MSLMRFMLPHLADGAYMLPMAEWHKPHEAIHVTVGAIPEST